MYGVFLVTDYTGMDGAELPKNYFLRYKAKDKFDCEVYAKQREYEHPADTHFEVLKLQG